jgi:hypothetical protein
MRKVKVPREGVLRRVRKMGAQKESQTSETIESLDKRCWKFAPDLDPDGEQADPRRERLRLLRRHRQAT